MNNNMNNMVKIKNVKALPMYSENFSIANKNDLVDMLRSIPIVLYDYDENQEEYKGKESVFDFSKLIGAVAPHGNIGIEEGFLTADIYIFEEYKDYVFKNCEFSIKTVYAETKSAVVKGVNVIGFGKGE